MCSEASMWGISHGVAFILAVKYTKLIVRYAVRGRFEVVVLTRVMQYARFKAKLVRYCKNEWAVEF